MFHLLFCLIGVADDLGSLIEHWEPLERSRAPAPCSRHASGHGRALPSTQESSLLWRAGGMRRRYACAVAPQESPSASVWRSAPERRTRSFRVHARAAAATGLPAARLRLRKLSFFLGMTSDPWFRDQRNGLR